MHSARRIALFAALLALVAACGTPPGYARPDAADVPLDTPARPTDAASDAPLPPDDSPVVPPDGPAPDGPAPDARPDVVQPPSAGRTLFERSIQPLIAERCGRCHVGERFGIATITRTGAGNTFTAADTARNYAVMLEQIALDNPRHSRLLAKILNPEDPRAIDHAGGPLARDGDALHAALLGWIEQEKRDRCPTCGLAAPRQYLAYVQQPRIHWAVPQEPINPNYGQRQGARIMLQPIDPATFTPMGAAIDFLPSSFCGPSAQCDFGHVAANHAGTQLAFECRMPLPGGSADYSRAAWNLCVAEIGADGRAVNPRFLLPAARRNEGYTQARSSPLGLYAPDGSPLKGPYDGHFRVRRRGDNTPVFGPDDARVYFASRGRDPRTGADGVQAYHGDQHTNDILAVDVATGADLRTVYYNEGGVADFPFFLRNGNLVLHTWNLERTDRHMYVQATADGMMEIPLLFGRLQGENMWGKATQLANGLIFGMTGRRRSQLENYVPFVADHTLGIGTAIDPTLRPFRVLDEALQRELSDFVFCEAPPEGPGCVLSHWFEDASYSPDGRAFVSHSPRRIYTSQGHQMMDRYARGTSLEERRRSVEPYLPTDIGISLVDHRGRVTRFLPPPAGTMLRYPAWVGRRAPETAQPWRTDERRDDAEIHIADFRLWLAFASSGREPSLRNVMAQLDRIAAVRVLVKEIANNSGMNDGYVYRYLVNGGEHDHPTHLGINNATGYTQLTAPASAGGDAFGDVPLRADGSVRVRVPARRLLLFQGVDAAGHVVAQHTRVFAMPPGQRVDTSVRRDQYRAHCGACHGSLGTEPVIGLRDVAMLPATPMTFDTMAMASAAVDLTSASNTRRLSFLHSVRPLLDRACVSCHSGARPAGELSLERTYSATANYPAGRWANPRFTDGEYLNHVPVDRRVPGYNFSMTYSWLMRSEDPRYRTAFASQIGSFAPLGELAPWDPAYQNLYATDENGLVYLSHINPVVHFGRGDRLGGNSRDSFLIEILTGRNLNPARTFAGTDHTRMLNEAEIRTIMAVLDVGFPYMLRGDDRMVPSGPNRGRPWADLVSMPSN